MEHNRLKGISLSPRKTAFGPILFAGDHMQGIQAAHQNQLNAVELSIRSIRDVNPVELVPVLRDLGMKISAIATGQACLFDELCLSSADKIKQAETVDHFKAITDLALELNAGAVIIGGIRGRLSGTPGEQQAQKKAGVEVIHACAQYTSQQEMLLLIEPINRYEMNWINTVQEGLELLDTLKLPTVKLLLDTFHMNIEEANTLEAFRMAGDQVGYVHFADNNRHAPGQGQIDFDSILQVLEEIRYSGPFISEILPLPDDLKAVVHTADFWRKREDLK